MHVGRLWDIVRDEIPPPGGGTNAWVADINPTIDSYITNYFRFNCKQLFVLPIHPQMIVKIPVEYIHRSSEIMVLDLFR